MHNLPRRILLPAQRLDFGHHLRSGHIRARGWAGRGVPAVCRGLLLPKYDHCRGVRPGVLLPTRVRVLYSLPRGQILRVQGHINAHRLPCWLRVRVDRHDQPNRVPKWKVLPRRPNLGADPVQHVRQQLADSRKLPGRINTGHELRLPVQVLRQRVHVLALPRRLLLPRLQGQQLPSDSLRGGQLLPPFDRCHDRVPNRVLL